MNHSRQPHPLLLLLVTLAGCTGPEPGEVYRDVLPGVVQVVMVQGLAGPPPEITAAAPPAAVAEDEDGSPLPRALTWVSASMGSGVLLDARGHIATAAHVLEGAERIGVVFAGNLRARARVVGSDPLTDLAVLQVERVPGSASPLRLVADPEPEVGDPVLTVGNPDGLPATLGTGVVSGLHRRGAAGIRVYHDFIQTDAPLFPGCSGGPLLDRHGRVIGLVTAVDRERRGAGFAIPARRALPVLEQLVASGKVVRGWLGATAKDVDGDLAQRLGLENGAGAEIWRLLDGGPAVKAGLLPGDVVLQAGGAKLKGRRDLAWAAALARPGVQLELRLLRRGKPHTVVVFPGARPEVVPEGGKNAF